MSGVKETWSYVRLMLDGAPDDETAALLADAAAEFGATGSVSEAGGLVFYFEAAPQGVKLNALETSLRDMAQAQGIAVTGLEGGEIKTEPWATAWKDDFKDTPVGERLIVRPEWLAETPAPAGCEGRLPVILRPGQGFGTGRHETTLLALAMLEENLRPGDRVLDFGTGSGILAIAAVRLGAAEAVGVDFDTAALENARDNLALNGMADRVRLVQADSPECLDGRFDLILCNVLPHEAAPVLRGLAMRLEGLPDPNAARLGYSGFLVAQRDETAAALAGAGLRADGWRDLGEWGGATCSAATGPACE